MKLILMLVGLMAGILPAIPVQAAGYPDRPIKLIVPYAPGSTPDTYSRWVSQPLSVVLGQPIVIENRPGAGGGIGTDAVAKSKPDGYTMLLAAIAPMTILPSVSKSLPYKPQELQPVSLLQVNPFLVVVPASLPVTDIASLVAYAKANPGKINFGSPGLGSLGHLSIELFNSTVGTSMVHIPFRSGAPLELIAGRIQLLFSNLHDVLPHVRSGKLRALAVTSKERVKELPDIPTVSESGLPGFEVLAWNGFAVAAGTPKDIVTRLNGEIEKILRTPEIATNMRSVGATPAPTMSPDDFAAYMASESLKWGNLAQKINLKLE
jgi:tripartite-type tricarboxylate transporter receptor subunit TctC